MISQKAARVSGPTAEQAARERAVATMIAQSRRSRCRCKGSTARQAAVEQAAYGRIGRGAGSFDDTGAIDDGADLHAEDVAIGRAGDSGPERRLSLGVDADHFRGHQVQGGRAHRSRG